MYKIEKEDMDLNLIHVDEICKKVQHNINEFLCQKNPKEIKIVDNDGATVYAKIEPGKLTDWFLRKLQNSGNLEKLIKGDLDYMKETIKEIDDKCGELSYPKEFLKEKATKKGIGEALKMSFKGRLKLDYFNEILYDIFVENGYNKVFPKNQLVKSLKLRVCPYCGRSYIISLDKEEDAVDRTVKPQLEHFFPKRKYPYLAMCIRNLFPVCSTCNMSDCKGEMDPLDENGELIFSYPYAFKDGDISFDCNIRYINYFDDDSFEISMNYASESLKKGCKDHLKLDSFYKYHNHEAASIYKQMMILKSEASAYYSKMGIRDDFLKITPEKIYGFSFGDKQAKRELMYLFKKDIFISLKKYLKNKYR